MPIPKRVVMGGTIWSIVEDNELKDSSHYGETRYTKDEIALDTEGRTSQRIRASLFHELIHAADSRFSTGEDVLSEAKVKMLSTALFDTFVGNPDVVDYILGRE